MKRCVMVWLAVSAFWATGCIRSFQVSTQPFFHDTEAPGDVTGRWLAEGDEAGGLELAPAAGGEWRVRLFDASIGAESHPREPEAVVRFGRVGDALYWDMTADTVDSTDLAKEHLLKLHSLARVRLDGGVMEIAFLDADWLAQAADDGRVSLAHFRETEGDADRRVVLTAPTEELEAFLRDHGDIPGVFDEPVVFHRMR